MTPSNWPFASRSSTRHLWVSVGNAGERVCNIGGHGNVGFFETGAGQKLPYADGIYVFGWNQFAWGPQFQRLAPRNYAMMTIWACDTGQGQDGADLLFAIAKCVGCPVRASSGEVITNGQNIWLEPNAVWVTATPTMRPTPVGPPHHVMLERDSDTIFTMEGSGRAMKISLENISEIRIERYGLGGTKRVDRLSGVAARALAWRLFGTKPFKLPGSPLAFVTAQADLTISMGKGKGTRKRTFIIYNDRLVYDTMSHDAYFARPGQSFGL
jgi:hypothetical protein